MAEDLSPSSGKIRIKITSPLAVVLDRECDSVLIPASFGDFLVMPRKAPAFYLLKKGEVIVREKGQPDKAYWVSMGVCEVRRDICAVIAWAEEKTSLRKDLIQKKLEEGEKVLPHLSAGEGRKALAHRMDFYRFILEEIKP